MMDLDPSDLDLTERHLKARREKYVEYLADEAGHTPTLAGDRIDVIREIRHLIELSGYRPTPGEGATISIAAPFEFVDEIKTAINIGPTGMDTVEINGMEVLACRDLGGRVIGFHPKAFTPSFVAPWWMPYHVAQPKALVVAEVDE